MFNNIKRFFKKNTRNNKQCPDIKIPGQIIKTSSDGVNSIISNNKNNMDLVVIGGHYCSNATVKADVKDIVRVLGSDKKREGYYVLDSGKSISEYGLLDDFVLLDTVPNNERNRKKDLLKGFTPTNIENQEEEESDDEEVESPYQRTVPEYLQPYADKQQRLPQQPLLQNNEETKYNDLVKLLERSSINTLNNNYDKKYGTKPYKETILQITVDVHIPYELNKLFQICELFEFDIKDVAEYLVSKVNLPKNDLIQKVTDMIMQSNIKQPVIVKEQVNTELLNETSGSIFEEKEEITSGISEVDDYLKNLFN